MKRTVIIFFIFLIFPSLLSADALKIKSFPVRKQLITKTIEKTGLIIPGKTIKISSETSGLLERLNVDKGEIVKKGMMLADVDRKTALLQVEEARVRYEETIVKKKLIDIPYRKDEIKVFSLRVDKAEADKKNAENALKRFSKLFSEGHASKEQLDDADTKYKTSLAALEITKKNMKIAKDGSRIEEIESAENEVLIAKKSLDIAKNNLKKTRIISVVNGTVSHKYVEEGEFVAAGQVLIEIVVLNPVKVSFAVSERELSYVERNETIKFSIPAVGKSFSGNVSFISPVADSNTHLFNVELSVGNKDKTIYPGMTAKVQISTNKITAYPISADWLRFYDDKLGVFVLSHGKVKFIPVNQDNYLAKKILLYDGIKEGDEIITFSSQKLIPGQTIK